MVVEITMAKPNIDAGKLALINDIALDLHSAVDLDSALNKSITVILESMQARQCYLFTRPRGSDVIVLEAASPGFEDLVGIIGYKKNEGFTGTIFAEGKGRILNDPPQHPEIWKGKYSKEFFERCDNEEVKTLIGVPLIYKDNTIGVIIITNRTKYANSQYFSPSHLDFLEILANHISGAIANARMWDEITLRNAILDLMPDLKFDKVLQSILSITTKVLKCDSGIIFVVDEENNLLKSHYSIGFDREIADNLTFSLSSRENALPVRAVLDKQPYFSKDVSTDTQVNRKTTRDLGISGPMILYPFVLEGKAIGAIGVYNRCTGRSLSEYDIEIIRPYVSHAALVLGAVQIRRQEVLRETEQITSIFNALGCGLSIIKKVKKDDGTYDLVITYMNDRQKDEFGDLTGQICHRAYNDFREPCTWCPCLKTFNDDKVHTSITYSPVKGEWRRYLVVSSPYDRWENGEVKAVLEAIVDLTEREVHLESVIDLHANMINATSVLAVGENVVELTSDIMKWDVGLFFLRNRRNPSLLRLYYEKGLGMESRDIGNISYEKELLPPDVRSRPYIYEVDKEPEQWESEKAIYPKAIQAKLENIKRVFIFPLNTPYSGEIGTLRAYSTSTGPIAGVEFEFEYLKVIEYVANSAAMTCERIRKQEEMIPMIDKEDK